MIKLRMNVFQTLICCFFLTALQTGLVNADRETYTAEEGGNITVTCLFTYTGKTMFFCKKECEEGNILVETTEHRADKGRYSIDYKHEGLFKDHIVNVTIRRLEKSDSGWYRCEMGLTAINGNVDFQIIVQEVSTTSKPTWTLQTIQTSALTSTTKMTPQSFTSTSGTSRPSSASSDITKQTVKSDVLLYVGLALALMIIILSVTLVLFYKNRSSTQTKQSQLRAANADSTQANQVYEEIREDRDSTSPTVKVFTEYAHVSFSKPNGAETSGVYSVAGCPLSKGDSLNYSEVHFPNSGASSDRRASSGFVDNGIYTNKSFHDLKDAPQTIYSTVSQQHQLQP